MDIRRLRWIARGLALLWCGFWTWFSLAELASDRSGLSHLPMVLLMVVNLWAAWKWEVAGGIILALEGLAILIAYPLMASHFPLATILFVLATLALPPLLAGILFILCGGRRSAPGPA